MLPGGEEVAESLVEVEAALGPAGEEDEVALSSEEEEELVAEEEMSAGMPGCGETEEEEEGGGTPQVSLGPLHWACN